MAEGAVVYRRKVWRKGYAPQGRTAPERGVGERLYAREIYKFIKRRYCRVIAEISPDRSDCGSLAWFQPDPVTPLCRTYLLDGGVCEHNVRFRHPFLIHRQLAYYTPRCERNNLCPGCVTRVCIGGDGHGLVALRCVAGEVDVVSGPVPPGYGRNSHLGDRPVGVGGDGDTLSRSTSSRNRDSGRADGEVSVASGLGNRANDGIGTTAIRRNRQLACLGRNRCILGYVRERDRECVLLGSAGVSRNGRADVGDDFSYFHGICSLCGGPEAPWS